MKKHCIVRVVFVWVLCLLAERGSAQEADHTTWVKVGVKHEVLPKLVLSGNLEWRTEDDLSRTDRWGLDVGGSYKLLPFLKVGAGYEVHYRNLEEDGWKFRHRYHADGTLSHRVRRLKLSLRERFQHTFSAEEKEFRLRSRLKVAYDMARCRLEPYVSVEMYNGLGRGERFDVARMRYRGGLSFPGRAMGGRGFLLPAVGTGRQQKHLWRRVCLSVLTQWQVCGSETVSYTYRNGVHQLVLG